MSTRITNTGRSSNVGPKKGAAKPQAKGGPTFVEELAGARERSDRREFEEMIQDVDREAEKLASTPSYENMEKYRAAVKKILQQADSSL